MPSDKAVSSSHRGALRPLMCPLPKRLKRVRRGSLATGHDLGDGDVTDEKKSAVVRVLFVRRCFPFLCPTSIHTHPCPAFISVKKVCACEATCWSSVLTYFRLVVTHIIRSASPPAPSIHPGERSALLGTSQGSPALSESHHGVPAARRQSIVL